MSWLLPARSHVDRAGQPEMSNRRNGGCFGLSFCPERASDPPISAMLRMGRDKGICILSTLCRCFRPAASRIRQRQVRGMTRATNLLSLLIDRDSDFILAGGEQYDGSGRLGVCLHRSIQARRHCRVCMKPRSTWSFMHNGGIAERQRDLSGSYTHLCAGQLAPACSWSIIDPQTAHGKR